MLRPWQVRRVQRAWREVLPVVVTQLDVGVRLWERLDAIERERKHMSAVVEQDKQEARVRRQVRRRCATEPTRRVDTES